MRTQKNNLEIMVLILLVIAFAILLFVFAHTAKAETICFDENTAARMVVELETGRIVNKQSQECQDVINSQATVIAQLEEINRLNEERVKKAEEFAKQVQALADLQSKTYETALKESKPSIFVEVGKALLFIGVGVLIGLLAF